MAISMDALLKIKADVQGEGAVQGLATKLGAVQGAAAKAQGGFKGLAGAAGGLVGGLQTLMPLATGAGLVAMGKGAIDAADDMNDLSQKTGVSVERLSQLKQAAEKSGTSLEGVGGAMVKLNKGLAEGADSKAGEALKSLGINANDASGKLKSTDQIMLEVADKFKAMPDGAQKSAMAMQLFGKSGADMIPMLNGGSESIKNLAVTMTGEFASGADEFNDKMVDLQTGMTKLGVGIGTALMPILGKLTDGLVALVNGFNTLPGPVQTVIALIAGIAIAWGPVTGAISAIGAIGAVVIPALTGVITWIAGTFVPGILAALAALSPAGWIAIAVAAIVAGVILFRDPIMKFIAWVGETISGWVQSLWQWGEPIREFWVNLWNGVTELATGAFEGLMQIAYTLFVQPWVELWNNVLKEPVTALWEWLSAKAQETWEFLVGLWGQAGQWWQTTVVEPIKAAWDGFVATVTAAVQGAWQAFIKVWQSVGTWWKTNVADPINSLWASFTQAVSNAAKGAWDGVVKIWTAATDWWSKNVAAPIQQLWQGLTDGLKSAMKGAADFIKGIWDGLIKGLKSVISGFLNAWINGINQVIRGVNFLIRQFNRLPGPDIALVSELPLVEMAKGGLIDRPTMALIGEGGEPEYVIPQSKMEAASTRYLAGQRGASILSSSGGGSGQLPAPKITIQTGPVLQHEGKNYITVSDLEAALRQSAEQMYQQIKTPAARVALGF